MNPVTFEELKGIYGKLCEERDSGVFSPRTAENVHQGELEHLNSMIELLEKVIREEGDPNGNFRILGIQEEERQRIARDLHDTSLQNLAHLIHKIELGTMFIDQDPVRAKLELAVVSKNLKEIINDIRSTIFNLRPMTFDDFGLKTAFERLIEQLNIERKYELDVRIENVSCESDLIMMTIYRIVQESLNNIDKHADADKILFHCEQINNDCVIEIRDNGKGFDWTDVAKKENKHFGLSLMKERVDLLGGSLNIISEKNNGTNIIIEIPLMKGVEE